MSDGNLDQLERLTVDQRSAKTFSGIFTSQYVVCKIYDQETADFLRKEFGVSDEEAA
ncbi:hypothetical protein [Sphingobium yanoikuyae]|uniref:hypothetical protein n=1 Tax=Sphingobium yanoikuyae TaxID=13690 RepID=UPI002FDD7036